MMNPTHPSTIVESMQLVTSPLGVARLLWWYGERSLLLHCGWPLRTKADDMSCTVEIWQRRDQLSCPWPVYPKGNLALVLAAVEFLEGRLRAPARTRRLAN